MLVVKISFPPILAKNSHFWSEVFNTFQNLLSCNSVQTIYRNSHPELLCKRDILKVFEKFTEKHLCWSYFLIKFQVYTYFIKLLRTASSDHLKISLDDIKIILSYSVSYISFIRCKYFTYDCRFESNKFWL